MATFIFENSLVTEVVTAVVVGVQERDGFIKTIFQSREQIPELYTKSQVKSLADKLMNVKNLENFMFSSSPFDVLSSLGRQETMLQKRVISLYLFGTIFLAQPINKLPN